VFPHHVLIKGNFAQHLSANIARLLLEIKFGVSVLKSMESGIMTLFAYWRNYLEADFTANPESFLNADTGVGMLGCVVNFEFHWMHSL
jgi:hypothetical protein